MRDAERRRLERLRAELLFQLAQRERGIYTPDGYESVPRNPRHQSPEGDICTLPRMGTFLLCVDTPAWRDHVRIWGYPPY